MKDILKIAKRIDKFENTLMFIVIILAMAIPTLYFVIGGRYFIKINPTLTVYIFWFFISLIPTAFFTSDNNSKEIVKLGMKTKIKGRVRKNSPYQSFIGTTLIILGMILSTTFALICIFKLNVLLLHGFAWKLVVTYTVGIMIVHNIRVKKSLINLYKFENTTDNNKAF